MAGPAGRVLLEVTFRGLNDRRSGRAGVWEELSGWRDRQVERFLSRAGAGDWEPVQGGQWPLRKDRPQTINC